MHVLILGTRGIPSKHSGFETFAQDFALFLRSRDHEVTVYCQVPDRMKLPARTPGTEYAACLSRRERVQSGRCSLTGKPSSIHCMRRV